VRVCSRYLVAAAAAAAAAAWPPHGQMQWLLTWVHVASSGQRPRRSPETCHGTSEASWAPASSATSLRPVGARPASLRPDWPAHPLAAQREAARHLGGAYMNLMHPTGKRAPRLESPREKAFRRGAYTRPWLARRLWRFPTKGSRPAHHTRHQPPVASSAMHVYGT
jgi:hypothetical protein